jgi:hypothetical protein
MKPQKIKLGAHTYEVRPQPIGYLMNELGPELQGALEAEVDGLDGARVLGAKAYETLKVFIPELMPLHEFLGFDSEEAMKAKVYIGREADCSPTAPQLTGAFKAVKLVNGGEVLDALKALLGPVIWEKATAFLVTKLTESEKFLEIASTSPTSAPSPTSPSTSGESGSTSSSTPSPIPTPAASAD